MMITHHRKMEKYMAWIFAVLLGWGCGQKAIEAFSSPEKTMQTYFQNSSSLRNSIDPVGYWDTISCFTSSKQEWFDQNYEALRPPGMDDSVWGMLNKVRKQASVLGDVVVQSGPYEGTITVESISENEVNVTVDGFDESFVLVKEGPNWKIRDLFGVSN